MSKSVNLRRHIWNVALLLGDIRLVISGFEAFSHNYPQFDTCADKSIYGSQHLPIAYLRRRIQFGNDYFKVSIYGDVELLVWWFSGILDNDMNIRRVNNATGGHFGGCHWMQTIRRTLKKSIFAAWIYLGICKSLLIAVLKQASLLTILSKKIKFNWKATRDPTAPSPSNGKSSENDFLRVAWSEIFDAQLFPTQAT